MNSCPIWSHGCWPEGRPGQFPAGPSPPGLCPAPPGPPERGHSLPAPRDVRYGPPRARQVITCFPGPGPLRVGPATRNQSQHVTASPCRYRRRLSERPAFGWTSQSPRREIHGFGRPDRPVAKNEASAIARGSELGFTMTEAARGREVRRGGSNHVTFKSHTQKASESRACWPSEEDAPGYIGGPALGAGRSCVTPGWLRTTGEPATAAGRICVTSGEKRRWGFTVSMFLARGAGGQDESGVLG